MRKLSDLKPNENLKNLLNRQDFLQGVRKNPDKVLENLEGQYTLGNLVKNDITVMGFEDFIEKS